MPALPLQTTCRVTVSMMLIHCRQTLSPNRLVGKESVDRAVSRNTPASQALTPISWSPWWHFSCCEVEAPIGSTTEKITPATGSRHWHIYLCCWIRKSGSQVVGFAIRPSSVNRSPWVSEWLTEWVHSSESSVSAYASNTPLADLAPVWTDTTDKHHQQPSASGVERKHADARLFHVCR